jgi:hypothetical protein
MTRVSISTSPKMSRKRINGPEAGFLEIPSQAALMALAWQNAPAAEAMAIMAPPTISDSLKREARWSGLFLLSQERCGRQRQKKERNSQSFEVLSHSTSY